MQTAICVAVVALVFSFGVDGLTARAPARARERLLVLNAPSAASQGFDSVLALNSRGRSAVLLGIDHQLVGARDVECRPTPPLHILVSQSDFGSRTHGFLILSRAGRPLHTLPSAAIGGHVMAYDRGGVLYTVEATGDSPTVFRGNVPLASLPGELATGRVAVDSQGNVYVTSPITLPSRTPKVFRIDPSGNLSVFADETQGLVEPYGIAIDAEDNVFVANTVPAMASFILKFDPSGAATMFASDIGGGVIRSMTFDADGNLYVPLGGFNTIQKFTKTGDQSVFADAEDGINFPMAVRHCAG